MGWSAGHSACYVSPYGDVYPCVQFPLPSGNIRETKFIDIWRHSPQLEEVRSITFGDLEGCSSCGSQQTCSRCPGLAWLHATTQNLHIFSSQRLARRRIREHF